MPVRACVPAAGHGGDLVVRVRMCVTVDVDAEAWALEYGVPVSDVREDVRAYMSVLVWERVRELGLGVDR